MFSSAPDPQSQFNSCIISDVRAPGSNTTTTPAALTMATHTSLRDNFHGYTMCFLGGSGNYFVVLIDLILKYIDV